MKKVLMISYYFPPLGGTGVFRSLKFVKYLPENGWDPVVITVLNSSYGSLDPSLLSEIPRIVQVERAVSIEHKLVQYFFYRTKITSRTFLIPDAFVGWLPAATTQSIAICRRERPRVIYASAPPYTAFLVGALVSQITGIPLVVDYRDPWTDNPYLKYPSKFHRKIEHVLESFVLATAKRIIVATSPMSEQLLKRYSWLNPASIVTVTNGYDEEDFARLPKTALPRKFRIAYTGSFYAGLQPDSFLEAVAEAIIRNPDLRSDLEIDFVGSAPSDVITNRLGLKDNIRCFGWVTHQEALRIASQSDVLLLIQPEEASRDFLTGKIFEYLRLSKPILALGGKGAVSNLLADVDGALHLQPGDTDAVAKAIINFHRRWKRNGMTSKPWRHLRKFDRRVLTRQLASILEEAAAMN